MKNKFFSGKNLFLFVFILINIHSGAQWTNNTTLNTTVCNVAGSQRDPRIIKDGYGGAFIVWKDSRSSVPDIFVQRINSAGIALWTLQGVGACTNPSDQSTPSIVSDMAGGIIVTWSDWRSGIERDIYAQRIDSLGNMLWTFNGAIVTNKTEREHNERIVSDGAGGCIIAWEQQNTTNWNWDIWAQRLNSNGVPQWINGGIPLCTNSSNKRNPKLQKDQSGGTYVTWQDLRNGIEYDIYAQHVSSSGTRLWGNSALAVCNASNDQNNPKIDPDSITGGVYIAWADERNIANGHDIYCQKIDPNGNFLWTTNGLPVCSAPGSQTAVDLLSNPDIDGVIAVWKDNRSTSSDIYAQRLNNSGVPQWITNGVPICTTNMPQINPNISYDESGGAVIVWQDSTSSTSSDIKAQRISSSGTLMWTIDGVYVSNNTFAQTAPKNISDETGGTIVVWEDYRTGVRDIYAHRIYANGTSDGIEQMDNNMITAAVYPNPFTGIFSIDFRWPDNDEINITIHSIDGKEVKTISPFAVQSGMMNHFEMDGSAFSNGIYFLSIRTVNYSANMRIVKY